MFKLLIRVAFFMSFSYKYMHLKAVFSNETGHLAFKTCETILNFFEQQKTALICLKTKQFLLFLPHYFHTLGSTPISHCSV